MGCEIPKNEAQRIAALQRYHILDTPADGSFDRITSIASRIFDTPIAIASLVDTDRIWFKSHHGLDVQQIDREPGLCASAILNDCAYIVNDARYDARTLANPLVAGDFGLQFYCAVPLKTREGLNLGTLCVIDFKPRQVSEEQIAMLTDLAQIIVEQMEMRLSAKRVDELNTALKDTQDELRFQATHDALTEIANRRAIMDFLDVSLLQSQNVGGSMAVMIFDIDFFKHVNDTYGHHAGDLVIKEVSKRLRDKCRATDSVGRMGGEEFLVVMSACDIEQAEQAAQRFMHSIVSEPIDIQCEQVGKITITASAGVYVSAESAEPVDAKTMVKYADERLYLAKQNGRERFVSSLSPV